MKFLRDPALVALTAALIFASGSSAQNNQPDPETVSAPQGPASTSRRAASSRQTEAAASTRSAAPSPTADEEEEETSRSGTAAPTIAVTNAPTISSSDGPIFHLTGLPSIAGAGIPTMIVPNTAAAPYMQKSTLPEGTVFICVGAILAFFGACVLAWRGLVAWSLHRSVKRAALVQSYGDSKHSLRGPGYSQVGAVSSASLDRLSQHITKTPKHHSAVIPPMPGGGKSGPNPAASSLFFSPTAGAGTHSAASRSSTFLPAGYYAAGTSSPAMGQQVTHIGAPPGPLSHGPVAAGYTRARSNGTSPPGSPAHTGVNGSGPYERPPGSRGNESAYTRSSVVGNVGNGGPWGHSSSSLNLSSVPQARAPSAYLEDLFENHGNGPRERF